MAKEMVDYSYFDDDGQRQTVQATQEVIDRWNAFDTASPYVLCLRIDRETLDACKDADEIEDMIAANIATRIPPELIGMVDVSHRDDDESQAVFVFVNYPKVSNLDPDSESGGAH